MNGCIKWFSSEKGEGLVTSEDDVDYKYYPHTVKGAALPQIGERVVFSVDNLDGQEVAYIKEIIKEDDEYNYEDFKVEDDYKDFMAEDSYKDSKPNGSQDQRVQCSCGKKVTPIIRTNNNLSFFGKEVNRHMCPFCGKKMYETRNGGHGWRIALVLIGTIIALAILCADK